ncbi:MAG: pyridoxamine 5'-phosphate oxidase family protein [Pseudomonadota bacterium]
MKKIESRRQLQQEVVGFRSRFKSVLLATASPENVPDASYTPYILDQNGKICIFVSQLAQHTSNLLDAPKASLLWIANEADSRNLFARRRLTLQCTVGEVAASGEQRDQLLVQMQQTHGKTIEVLRSLPDFHLFSLEAYQGNYVRGFGQAFSATGDELLAWLENSSEK